MAGERNHTDSAEIGPILFSLFETAKARLQDLTRSVKEEKRAVYNRLLALFVSLPEERDRSQEAEAIAQASAIVFESVMRLHRMRNRELDSSRLFFGGAVTAIIFQSRGNIEFTKDFLRLWKMVTKGLSEHSS